MIKVKSAVFCAVLLALMSSANVRCFNEHKKGENAVSASCNVLTIYYPEYSRIDLICDTMPSEKDSEVVFCCAAAYTGKCLKYFSYDNIVGSFVSGGIYHSGTYSSRVNGAFTFYDGQAHFYFNEHWKEGKEAFVVADSVMRIAAQHQGMGFWQDMLIHNYQIIEHERPDDQVHKYRSLCLFKDRVCIIQSDEMPLGAFIQELVNLGVQEALYVDMGTGWNHSWYRKGPKQTYTEIFPKTHPYQTNWITFYK